MRRTPAAAPVSCVKRNSPICPVVGTCVPPHSSSETPGTSTTRTMSPYFSVKNAIAPAAIASWYFICRVSTGRFSQMWANLPVETRQMKYQEAIAAGAMAFLTEKYGDIVRVVDVPGVSLELCGGTHVPTTGQIGLFRFTHETGAAAGVRRIEAVTGPGAYELIRKLEAQLEAAAGALKAQPEHLVRRIETLRGWRS